MIKIVADESDKNVKIMVKGHAQYAESGKDIVCAAVSTLVYTLIAALEKEEESEVIYSLQEGDVYIQFNLKNKKIKNFFDVIFLGITMVSENFNENVSVTRGEIKTDRY